MFLIQHNFEVYIKVNYLVFLYKNLIYLFVLNLNKFQTLHFTIHIINFNLEFYFKNFTKNLHILKLSNIQLFLKPYKLFKINFL